MLNIAIVEDNPIHMEHLQNLLPDVIEEPFVVSSFSSCSAFTESLEEESGQFDIAFMDIELGEESGIHAAESATRSCPGLQIIYISQYLNYISPVYETKHLYFIYKPDLNKYLKQAVDKALDVIQDLRSRVLEISWNKEKFHILEKDIMYLERVLRTTMIYTPWKHYHSSEKLSDLLPRMKGVFVRCQQSFVVNLNFVSSFQSTRLCLTNGKEIPVSRRYRDSVMQELNSFFSS
ncbi:MAG TPA: LytTR family DNA-binding domain-containing protein [Candidatus Mediterraneibacter ornithocaccae]|nr:LytTR family DNA-binding domain-containing protein [Candidatus Mediterraneibacter ornithocaccae]